MNAYPTASTMAQLRAAAKFAIREGGKPGVTSAFGAELKRAGRDIEAFLNGGGNESQVKRDVLDLARACNSYGVKARL